MLELTEQNAAEVLHAAGHLSDVRQVRVRELSGGVSNAVFLIERPSANLLPERFVVKQARGKLRVQADWRCSVERIWREVDVLRACGSLLIDRKEWLSSVPEILWSDRELYAYAMTAAPAHSRTWKELLLQGDVDVKIATACGTLLGALHSKSWHAESIAEPFDDRTYFDDLRLSPYYRHAAAQYPDLASDLNQLVEQTWQERHALVHGDFSPKNLLVADQQVMLIDFEVGHYGDPAFDLGFFLTHLVLKCIHLPAVRGELRSALEAFWRSYVAELLPIVGEHEMARLDSRAAQNLAGCLVARVHGKSPVDYLAAPEQEIAVQLASSLFRTKNASAIGNLTQLLSAALK